MELRAASAGSYPRIGDAAEEQKLRYAYASFRAGELQATALRQLEDEVATQILAEQVAAGLDLVTDGLVRWYDPISHIAQALMGTEPGRLEPYFRTGAAFRRVLVRGPLLRTRPIVVHEFAFAAGQCTQPVRAVLTGPITLAQASDVETPAYPSLATLASAYAEILAAEISALVEAGAKHIQIDEPALAADPALADLAPAVLGTLGEAKGESELTLALFLGDPAHVVPVLETLPVDVFAFDTLRAPRTREAVRETPPPQRLGLGVVDATSVASDDIASRIRTLEPILARVGPGPHYLLPTDGLERLPRPAAREKIQTLARVRRTLVDGNGATP